jgi:glutamine cyclotransferase
MQFKRPGNRFKINLSITRLNCKVALLLMLLIEACSGPDRKDPPDGDKPGNHVEFAISLLKKQDSLLLIGFSGASLSGLQSPVVRLNGNNSEFEIISEQQLSVKYDQLLPGKNLVEFSFSLDSSSRSIVKEFCHTEKFGYKLVNTFKHDPFHFTQGLLYDGEGRLYESTGLQGRSGIFVYQQSVQGFRLLRSLKNESHEFGEGITIHKGQLLQLLWKNRYLKIYGAEDLGHIKNLDYQNEGWGICSDGNNLYTSNGSNNIFMPEINGNISRIIKTIKVTGEKGAVSDINELEFINGMLFANIWKTDLIFIIDPETGYVAGSIDLTTIAEKERQLNPGIDVMNGIAWNSKNNTLLITGKFWSKYYEIQIVPGNKVF